MENDKLKDRITKLLALATSKLTANGPDDNEARTAATLLIKLCMDNGVTLKFTMPRAAAPAPPPPPPAPPVRPEWSGPFGRSASPFGRSIPIDPMSFEDLFGGGSGFAEILEQIRFRGEEMKRREREARQSGRQPGDESESEHVKVDHVGHPLCSRCGDALQENMLGMLVCMRCTRGPSNRPRSTTYIDEIPVDPGRRGPSPEPNSFTGVPFKRRRR